MSIKQEYSIYQSSTAIELIAQYAHQLHYCGQTSSVAFAEISNILDKHPINSNSSILDLGCGNGTFSLQIASRYNCQAYGIDIASSLIDEAKSLSKKYLLKYTPNYIVGNFKKIPFNNKKFHCLLIIGSLYWSKNLTELLNHWRHFLEQDGIMLLSLNLELENLSKIEKTQLENTYFIKTSDLYKSIELSKLKIIEEVNNNYSYLFWLNRWCDAMQLHKQQLYKELGKFRGDKFIQRFEMYKHLSCNNKVNKFNIVLGSR